MFKKTPLSGGFMFVGLLGIIIFGIRLIYGTMNQTWALLMVILSSMIFISAVISITPQLPRLKDNDFDRELEMIKKEYEIIGKQISQPLSTFSDHIKEKNAPKRIVKKKNSLSKTKKKVIKAKPKPKVAKKVTKKTKALKRAPVKKKTIKKAKKVSKPSKKRLRR